MSTSTSNPDAADSTPADKPTPRFRTVLAWASWDWGSSAFNAVITSFVFAPYVIQGVVGDTRPGGLTGNTWLGISTACAGVLIALLASVTGQRADAGGHRRRSLAIWTGLVVLTMLAMFSVKNDPSYLWIALALLGIGAIFSEFAGVSYNAMLRQVSTPATVGRVSGFGWAMGYAGGIVLLLVLYLGVIHPDVGWFGVTSAGGLRFRAVAVIGAVWFALFALPVLFAVPEVGVQAKSRRVGLVESYKVLVRDVRELYHRDRNAVFFLIASALYRDGLAAVFTFGAILAVSVYGMAQGTVLIFGIVANFVAAIGALVMGRLEDRIGPHRVIVISLIGLIASSLILLFVHGVTLFWVFGLILTLWVGPAQASSRAFMVRVAPEGREGQMFGLYATTGRAVSFLAPALFALFSGLFGDRVGIVGIALVLLVGLIALLRVRPPEQAASPRTEATTRG